MAATPPPAIVIERPTPPAAMITIMENGKVEIDWPTVREVARYRPADGKDRTSWAVARALMVAHGEEPNRPPLASCFIQPVIGGSTCITPFDHMTVPAPNLVPPIHN